MYETSDSQVFGSITTPILLVEDSLVNQAVERLQLELLGFTNIQAVSNGLEAVLAVSKQHYSLILMDCLMPVKNGFEATQEIRKLEKAKNFYTPIIAMTSNTEYCDRERCLVSGMDDYLIKPLEINHLCRVLAKWLALELNNTRKQSRSSYQIADIDGQVIDPNIINEFRLLEEKQKKPVVAGLAKLFLVSTPDRLDLVRNAVKSYQLHDVAEFAHGLKSSSASIGAKGLANICTILEEMGRTGARAGIENLLNELEAEYVKVCRELQKLVSSN